MSALRLMLRSDDSDAADCTSVVDHTLKLLRSPNTTVEWLVDDVAFVMLLRGFSALCEAAHAVVWECRKQRADVDHIEHCHPCRQQLCQCTRLIASDVKRGDKKSNVTLHLTDSSCTCTKSCAQLVQNCLHDVGPLVSHMKHCRACMPSAPDKELEVVRTTRNLMFHGSKKELVSLVLSTLMCVEVVMNELRCGSKHDKLTMQGKAKSVLNMREQLQAFAQLDDASNLVCIAAAAIRSEIDLYKCPSLPNAAELTDFDVVKHVLFGSVRLPSCVCICFKDMMPLIKSGNLGILKSVLRDPSCVSSAAYTEVLASAPGSTSLAEVSQKLHSRFTSSAANLAVLNSRSAAKNAIDAAAKATDADMKFCRELEKIAGAAPSSAVPSTAADIESLLSAVGRVLLKSGASLCAVAQDFYSKGDHWLLLQHAIFSGDVSDGVADCDCAVKQDSKDARLVYVKEKLKPWKGKARDDAFPLVPTAAVHLAELARVYGAAYSPPHAAVCVHLPDSSIDSKFLPIKLDPLLVARRSLIDRCFNKMWAAIQAPGQRQLLLLHGISGVGKTCAAVAAIYQLQRVAQDDKCTILIQLISGHSAAAVRGEYVKFGRALSRRLRLDENTKDDEVIARLTSHLKHTRYAIFADDANEEGLAALMQLLPVSSEGCTVIATSRLMTEGDGKRVAAASGACEFLDEAVACFSSNDALECLRACDVNSVFVSDPGVPSLLEQRLGHLPLAIRVFATWLRNQDASAGASDVLARWSTMQDRVLKESMPEHIRAVVGTVRLALDDLRREGSVYVEAGLQLLGMLTMCPPVGVSWSLFDGRGVKPLVDGVCSELQNEDGLCAVALHLQQCTGLVQVDVAQRLFGMHVLVQDAVFAELSSQQSVPLEASTLEDDNELQVFDWLGQSGAAGSHIVSLVRRVCCHVPVKEFLPLYTDAAGVCVQVLDIIQRRQTDRSSTLSRNSLKPFVGMSMWAAGCLAWIGRHQEALSLRMQSLRHALRLLPSNDVHIALCMDNLASSYGYLGMHREAMELNKETLAMYQRILPEEHPDIATSMSNLASSYRHLGMYREAMELRKEAQAMLQRILPEEHPDIAASMSNLASLYDDQGMHREAMELNKETLAMRQRILPEEHPDIATSMGSLASSYCYLGMYHEAMELNKETLAMRQRILPEEHPHIALSMGSLATSYDVLGMHHEAMELNKETLAMRQRILPEEHPHIATNMSNLAASYDYLSMHHEAMELNKETLAMRQRILPEEHPDIAVSMSNLALSYGHLGMYRDALQLTIVSYKSSFDIFSKCHLQASRPFFQNLICDLCFCPGFQHLACDHMYRLLCFVSATDDADRARAFLLQFALDGLPVGVFVPNGRATDLLYFVPLLLDVDASLAGAAAQDQDSAVIARCMLLRVVAEACKLGGQFQQALRMLYILDGFTTPHIARSVQSRKSFQSGDLGVSAQELQRVRLAVQMQMKKATGAQPPLPSFHDALVKSDAAQVTIPAVEAGEFHAACDAFALPPLLHRVGCRVRLQGLLQKQAVLNGAEGVVVSGVENRRVVVRLTRATGAAMEEWKDGFRVMVDKVQCLSLFEDL
jgi:tetratricopeptide (TPR) repeat protein